VAFSSSGGGATPPTHRGSSLLVSPIICLLPNV
jgi:hypothetical protein